MSDPHALVETVGHVLVVTMNRPAARNAFTSEMLVRMWDGWQRLEEDDELRCAILTGAGGNFCAGADLKEMHGERPDNAFQRRLDGDRDMAWRALLRHHRPSKPIIAAVEGFAVAGGTEILQGTQIRVAAQSAAFGVTEAQLGLFPLGGSTVRLRRQIPYTLAAEMLLTGRRVTAEEALRFGLIGRVVPDGDAVSAAMEIAERISRNGPLSVRAIMRSLHETEGLSEEEGLARELEIGWPVFETEDAREGPRAFAEKREPQFKGR